MRMFLRRSGPGRDPLPVAMSGVRGGERILQIGPGEPRIAGALAAKAGINGHAAAVVRDEPAARRMVKSAEQAAALIEVHVASFDALPFEPASFDVAVVHNVDGFIDALPDGARVAAVRESHRVLRKGGRVVVIEAGTRTGIGALLRPAPKPDERYAAAGGTVAALKAGGFTSARILADREGYRFIEGLKT
jgi:ubiquinone/menaquinone biosynthesis C-methylase UbiE